MMSTSCSLHCDYATHEAAKYACEHWHYSKCLPPSKTVKIGVWEDERFVGVVVFGVGATASLVRQYGLKPTEGCELVRIALRQHKHFVSEIMAQAIKYLRESNPGLRLIVSFADPEQGHIGAIYQATNWIYTGQSQASEEFIVNGVRYHGRTLRHGKPANMTTKEYAKKLDPNSTVIMGSSKHRYLMPLDRKMRKQIAPLAKPYPKKQED